MVSSTLVLVVFEQFQFFTWYEVHEDTHRSLFYGLFWRLSRWPYASILSQPT